MREHAPTVADDSARGEEMTQPAIDPAVVADRDLAIWLERSEALAYGKDAYEAAAELPGNPTGALTAALGGGRAFAVTAIDFGFFNRMIGLGIERPATEDDVEAVSRFFLDLGRTQSVIQVAPTANPHALSAWMEPRGYRRGARWVKMWRRLDDLPKPSTFLRIERVQSDAAEAFSDVVMASFEMPPEVRALTSAVVGRPGWTHYLGYDGQTPVAAGAMYVADGVAWLGYGGTLESFRGRGGQSAMFAARLRDARDLGCRWAITETGAETEASPVNHSYRNMVRLGFRLAYERQNWVRVPDAG